MRCLDDVGESDSVLLSRTDMKALAGRFYKYILKHNNNRYCVVDMFISHLGEREGWD